MATYEFADELSDLGSTTLSEEEFIDHCAWDLDDYLWDRILAGNCEAFSAACNKYLANCPSEERERLAAAIMKNLVERQ